MQREALPTVPVPARSSSVVWERHRVSRSIAASCPGIRHLHCQTFSVMPKRGKWLMFKGFVKIDAPYGGRRAECSRAKPFVTVPNSARNWAPRQNLALRFRVRLYRGIFESRNFGFPGRVQVDEAFDQDSHTHRPREQIGSDAVRLWEPCRHSRLLSYV